MTLYLGTLDSIMCVCKLGPTTVLSNFLKTEITITCCVTKYGPAMIYAVRSFGKVCVELSASSTIYLKGFYL